MRAGLDAWHAKAEGKAAIDYGFHMIMTEANPSTLEEMAAMVREGVTSFKMFMAYPGVFLVDDQQIFRAMLRAGELGALITMHAEIGLPIDVLVAARARRGPHRAGLPRADAARGRRGDRHRARDRARRDGGGAGVHGAPVGAARARARDGGARPRPAGVRRDLPAVPVLLRGRSARRAGRRVEGRRATCARRRCGPSTTTITCGAACATTTSRSSRPITARSA